MTSEDRLGLIDGEILSDDPDHQSDLATNQDLVNELVAYTVEVDRDGNRNGFVNHLGSSFRENFDAKNVCLGAATALLATVIIVLFPSYLNAASVHSDAYCALLFCSIISTILVAIATFVFKILDPSLKLKPPISYKLLSALGCLYGCCGLVIFYSRDRNRVLCHLQDPLAAILLPAAVLFHLFHRKVDKVPKLVCIAAAIIGLFICVDFQIWDEFSCHGDIITNSFDDGKGWSSWAHIAWTVVYVAAIALLAFFYVTIDQEVKILISVNNNVYVPLEGISRNQENNIIRSSTSDEISVCISSTSRSLNNTRPSPHKTGSPLVLLFWLQLLSTFTILILFWTDLISVVGKAGSATNFRTLMKSGWNCYFGVQGGTTGIQCNVVALLAWMFIISYTLLSTAVLYLMAVAKGCSATYVVGIKVLCLPLSTIWWSVCQTGAKWQWAPVFSGETGFTVVGLPVMIAALVLYKYYAYRERII